MRSILLSKSDELYLQKCAAELNFAYGLVVGQRAEPEKYVVVHLAKNGEEELDLPHAEAGEETDSVAAGEARGVDDIDTQALTHQWISACKMIPGSFQVLGVFASSDNMNTADEQTWVSAKKLLYDVHNLLLQSCCFSGFIDNSIDESEYIFLAYSTTAKKAVCKLYAQNSNGGTFSPMDCRFVEKAFEWYNFECSYELDDIFPIIDATQKINIEQQFLKTIAAVRNSLKASEIFIQNESVADKLSLDAYIKQKRSVNTGSRQSQQPGAETLKASIFLPVSATSPVKLREFNGTIRFTGSISSRIWCNPKNTLGDVKRFVRDDIVRSLAARIQVYCDGLTEPNISCAAIYISEPPRRVYFNLAASPEAAHTNPIQFSEYIFRGEAPTVAVAQAKQILDLDINSETIVADLEGLPDDVSLSEDSIQAQPPARPKMELTRNMYMVGIAVALLVLLASILLHFILQP